MLIGLLIIVAIIWEIFHRLNPFRKPDPPYEELLQQIRTSDWYQELAKDESYRYILENDPNARAFFSGTYEAQRLLQSEGFQLGLIDYVKTQANRPDLTKKTT
ncbi:hypothetical protein [Brevibacillus sp. SYSU BS000544]|uniref:hypothetical protein n=1 Tax=Brevibacillus sp. SYSU BS000544 TaxID=3416443 RepID=UPI003CE56BA2